MPQRLEGMNIDLMSQYIKHVADAIMNKLGLKAIFHDPNPVRNMEYSQRMDRTHVYQFPFMETTMLDGRTNFFERRVSDYRQPGFTLRDSDASQHNNRDSALCSLYVAFITHSSSQPQSSLSLTHVPRPKQH